MTINERSGELGDYPFTRLRQLLTAPPRVNEPALILSVGEPRHAPPPWLTDIIAAQGNLWNRYPPIAGSETFRHAAVDWLERRYHLAPGQIDPEQQILALSGTKEGLFAATQLVVPTEKAGQRPVVLMPNPFYQVYQGAGVMAGAETIHIPASAETGFLPDFSSVSAEVLARTAAMFICTPSNPQGAVANADYLADLLRLARRYDFVLMVDECYSEIYDRAPPPGILEVASGLGAGFDNILAFHSLSKRSNVAGLRAGFVTGDLALIQRFFTLRNYGGSQVPLPLQEAAAALWRDEAHVIENRALYRHKIDLAEQILGGRFGFYRPEGGFFLWLDVGDGEDAAFRLWRDAAVKVLPGGYLAATQPDGYNPGQKFIRIALVDAPDMIADALTRLVRVLS